MGGSYAYCLGYMEQGQYRGRKTLQRSHFALVADAPSPRRPDRHSDNHGGEGQNVLFEDGHVSFLRSSRSVDRADDIFLNDAGLVGAGVSAEDAVLGPSDARP